MKKKFLLPYRVRAVWAVLLLGGLLAAKPASAQVSVETSAGINTEVTGGLEIVLDGNWTNNGALLAGNGAITFNGSGTQTLFNAAGAFNNLNVNKHGGEVLLLSNITVAGNLALTGGDVALNGQIITLETNALLSETAGNTVNGATGHIETTRDINAPSNGNVGGLGFEITTAANLGSTQIIRSHAAQSGNGNQSILRYFDVSPANNAGLNATVAFHYDDSELNGNTEAALRLFRSPDAGANWENLNGLVNTSGNTVTQSGLGQFSRWALSSSDMAPPNLALNKTTTASSSRPGYPPSNAVDGSTSTHWRSGMVSSSINAWLRVDLGATYTIGNVVINWSGSFYAKKYTVQISLTGAGGSWTTVHTDNAGNGGIDNITFAAASARYVRVFMTQHNEQVERINEVEVYAASGALAKASEVASNQLSVTSYQLEQNYPNPFNPSTVIGFQLPVSSEVSLAIYNMRGQLVRQLTGGEYAGGRHQIVWDATDSRGQRVASGVYMYVLKAGDFVSHRKLILMK